MIGFAGYGVSRDEDLNGYGTVFALYVLSEYWGRGVGYALMNEAVARLDPQAGISLWVLDGNERAIRFYERYGFRFDGHQQEIEIGGEKQTERRMQYRRI